MTQFNVHFACGEKLSLVAAKPQDARDQALAWYARRHGINGRITKVKAPRR